MRLGLIRDFQEINYPKKQTTPDVENTERIFASVLGYFYLEVP